MTYESWSCQIITIGDYSKRDTRKFFRERILPTVPEDLRPGLEFERLYEAFGGKIAHWQDFVTDFGEYDMMSGFSFILK